MFSKMVIKENSFKKSITMSQNQCAKTSLRTSIGVQNLKMKDQRVRVQKTLAIEHNKTIQ
jgi:hypothetical protein